MIYLLTLLVIVRAVDLTDYNVTLGQEVTVE